MTAVFIYVSIPSSDHQFQNVAVITDFKQENMTAVADFRKLSRSLPGVSKVRPAGTFHMARSVGFRLRSVWPPNPGLRFYV